MDDQWLNEVCWDENGLVPVITQDYETGKVLMLAWMNRESLLVTGSTRRAVYWSRSRARLWKKGEASGHEQLVHEIRLDCDNDAVLLVVEQKGGIACHTGRYSCFYKQEKNGSWKSVDPVLKQPNEIYQKKINEKSMTS
ncbi:MAG: phosphoribosyl-AMP cyclohydrolase [Gammaproteobacteria bacterium]